MNRILLPLLALIAGTAAAGGPYADGQALAQAVYDRPNGDDSIVAGKMILTESGKEPRVRDLYTFAKDKGGGQVMNLIRFLTPADVTDVGMLTVDYPGAKSDQWLYLPALGKVRRVPSERQGGRFVGSDLYNEDLKDREPDLDTHTIVGEEKYKGVDTTVLESVPVDPSNSSYDKRVSWINTDILIPVRVDFYQNGQLIKRAEALRIEKKQGYWTVMEQKMTHLDSDHSTRTTVEQIRYDLGLPDEVFTQQVLEDPQRDKGYLAALQH